MIQHPVLIVGSIALDTIESPNGNHKDLIGGTATYAMIAAYHKAMVHVCGIVGSDFPQSGHQIFKKYAKDLADFTTREGKTFRWGGRYHSNLDQRDTLFTDLGVFENYEPKLSEINKEQSYVFLANNHPQLQLFVAEQMKNHPTIVVDTMNLWINTTYDDLLKILKQTDILLLNDSESELLSGISDLSESAEKIRLLGPKTIVIKRGSKGASIFTEKEQFSVGVYPVDQLVDTTGAGDTFGGGFIATLANGGSLVDSVISGSALASVCVEGFGVNRLLDATIEEINHREAYLSKTVCT